MMNQAEQQVFLDAAEKAFVTFQQCTADFVFSEDLARSMAETLKANGLDPRKPEHLSLAWSKLRSAPASVPEPVDDVEREARALIESGRVSLSTIEGMSNNGYELAARNPVFCRAVEILTPKRETPPPTHGDLALEANLNERLRQVAITERAAFDIAPPTSGVRSSVQNDAKQIPIPKSFATQKVLNEQIKREHENEQLILAHRDAVMQRRRDIAHRGKK